MDTKNALQKAILAAGNQSALARSLGIAVQSVQQWEAVPAKRVLEVERLTGISRHELRPDIYGESPVSSVQEPQPSAGAEEPQAVRVRDAGIEWEKAPHTDKRFVGSAGGAKR